MSETRKKLSLDAQSGEFIAVKIRGSVISDLAYVTSAEAPLLGEERVCASTQRPGCGPGSEDQHEADRHQDAQQSAHHHQRGSPFGPGHPPEVG